MTERLHEQDEPREKESLEDYLGPFYDDAGLMKRYSCSAEDLNAMVEQGLIISVPTDEDTLLYPVFQFPDQVHPHPDMPAFVEYMRGRPVASNPSIDIALHLKVCPNPYVNRFPNQDTSTTLEMIHGGRVADAIRYWEIYYKGLEGPGGGWY